MEGQPQALKPASTQQLEAIDSLLVLQLCELIASFSVLRTAPLTIEQLQLQAMARHSLVPLSAGQAATVIKRVSMPECSVHVCAGSDSAPCSCHPLQQMLDS
jgi:hypothetical protein